MIFNSIEFLVFFLAFVLCYSLARKSRWMVLLAFSYFFYGYWDYRYLGLIIGSTLLDYSCGIGIAKTLKWRKPLLCLSLTMNLGALAVFKYYNFFAAEFMDAFGIVQGGFLLENILLPVGISFYTFQTMCYTIDIYRGKLEPEYHLGVFACYVAFFPQLVAGPIERAQNLLPQIKAFGDITWERLESGALMFLMGLVRKVVIADTLGGYVDGVYYAWEEQSGLSLMLAGFFFGIQIYGDFSGYSLMAKGIARCMGVELMVNFNSPYISQSIGEFWRRWHISLSQWFRDYVYIPLGGSRTESQMRRYSNVMTVFLVSGLWHGANWTFIVWGAYHGLLLVLEDFMGLRAKAKSWYGQLGRMVVVLILVNIGWIFFRCTSVEQAWLSLQRIFMDFGGEPYYPKMMVLCLMYVALSFAIDFIERRTHGFSIAVIKRPLYATIAYAALFAVILLGNEGGADFIYFQF